MSICDKWPTTEKQSREIKPNEKKKKCKNTINYAIRPFTGVPAQLLPASKLLEHVIAMQMSYSDSENLLMN